jgi:hypothetical protein
VAHVDDLAGFVRGVADEVERRGEVVHAHLVPSEVPVLGAADGEVHVSFGVGVTSGVAHPDVVSGVGEHERWKKTVSGWGDSFLGYLETRSRPRPSRCCSTASRAVRIRAGPRVLPIWGPGFGEGSGCSHPRLR